MILCSTIYFYPGDESGILIQLVTSDHSEILDLYTTRSAITDVPEDRTVTSDPDGQDILRCDRQRWSRRKVDLHRLRAHECSRKHEEGEEEKCDVDHWSHIYSDSEDMDDVA